MSLETASTDKDAADLGTPLCVDLDGTLIDSDVLIEGFLQLLKKSPLYVFAAPWWLLRGKAHLKEQIALRTELDVGLLPVNGQLLEWLQVERQRGRQLILCTAADRRVAERVANHYGIFEEVIASDRSCNLSGTAKAQALTRKFGTGNFDYAGNELTDMRVWSAARRSIVVSPTWGLQRRLNDVPRLERVVTANRPGLSPWIRALRLHQWAKNLLIFVPLAASHRLLEPHLLPAACLAFLWFGICASATYMINDLLDLEADRAHPRKRTRPFAAGQLPPAHGMAVAPAMILIAFCGAAITLGGLFTAILLLYLVGTLWYSATLKRIAMVDVLALAGLYTVRLIAGGAAVAVIPSFWLLAFSMFMFLSLAIVKRYTELRALLVAGRLEAAGRGYTTDDLPLLLSCGISAGFVSVLVLAMYINDGSMGLYRRPEALWLLCPLVLYWICRIWRKGSRGELHDDPVVFALKDGWSMVVGVCCLILLWAAT